MRNRIKTVAAGAAVVTAIGVTMTLGGLTAASADPGGTPGESAEWCDSEEHAEMASHMSGSMGMGDWDADMGSGMGSGSGMGR